MKSNKTENRSYKTISQLLQHCGDGRKDETVFVEEKAGGQHVTYARWERDLLETSGKFAALGAKHIGLVCDLSYDCILCLYSIMLAGKIVVPLEADMDAGRLDDYIKRADIEMLLYNTDRLEGTVTACECRLIPEFLNEAARGEMHWPDWEKDRPACIAFSSGTEGVPRGAVLTQGNLAFTNSYGKYVKKGQKAKILLFLPIHHVLSLKTLTNCIHDGTCMHLGRGSKYVMRDMETVRPDVIVTVPMVNRLFQAGIEKAIEESGRLEQLARLVRISNSLRKFGLDLRTPLFRGIRAKFGGIPQLIISGGSAVPEESVRFFDDFGIIVLQSYGMTEACGPVSTNMLEKNRLSSVGQIIPVNEVRIVDSEVQLRGPNVMKEYYKDPEATKKAFADDWFRTGDLGYMDKDGFLFITGRKKNLIILDSGENVSPEELERELLRSAAIAEIVVSEREGRIHAEIFPDRSVYGDEAELKEIIKAELDALNRTNPVYKRISSWELRSEPFEKTASAKIRR